MKQALDEDHLFWGLVMLDQCLFAEFFYADELSLGLGFMQKIMFCDQSEQQVLCCGRKVAKTIRLEARVLQVAMLKSGEGMLNFPGQRHLDPVRERVYSKVNGIALFRAMRDSASKGDGIERWRGGKWTWYWRIEGMDGTDRNMVGLRASVILGDEMAFGNMPCFNSRNNVALPHCEFIYAGVPNNWRSGVLYRLDRTRLGNGWSIHRMDRYDNPLFDSEEAKDRFVRDSGGETSQEYITQVLGRWGEELASSFPPGAIAEKHTLPLWQAEWNSAFVHIAMKGPLRQELQKIPSVEAMRFAIGVDYGYSPDPAVILVFYEGQPGEWFELAHLELSGVVPHHQAAIIHAINERLGFRVVAIAIEYVGGGLSVAQELGRSDISGKYADVFDYASIVVDSAPGGAVDVPVVNEEEKAIVGADTMGYYEPANPQEKFVRVPRKVWMTDYLRLAMIRAVNGFEGLKIWLGPDKRLVESIANIAESRGVRANIIYTKLERDIPDHPADALRNAFAAIDHASKHESSYAEPSYSEYGWVRLGGNREWTPPWHLSR